MYSKAKTVVVVSVLSIGLLIVCCAWVVHQASSDLPEESQIRETILKRYPSKTYATWVPLNDISPQLQQAVITWEDPTFYANNGFNIPEIMRSVVRDVRAGAYVRGGSTITQQVAKNMYLSPRKTLRRKLREAILTFRIEHALSKHEILEVYLNIAEWGLHIQGIEAAARYYFDKSAASLNWEESALLAGILQNPVLFNPRIYPKRAREKQVRVLDKLLRFGKLSPTEHAAALRKYIRLNPDPLLLQGAHSRQLQDGSGKSRP
jgi:membrane peptidoglycan carboxypeptidase